MSFRIEKKFKLTKFEQKSLKESLIMRGMKELYPKRAITSWYFDSHDRRFRHGCRDPWRRLIGFQPCLRGYRGRLRVMHRLMDE